jgi:hypothetical protein
MTIKCLHVYSIDAILNRVKGCAWLRTYTLQRTNTKNLKQIFPEKKLRSQSPNFHIHVSVSDLYIPTINLPTPLQEIQYVDRS